MSSFVVGTGRLASVGPPPVFPYPSQCLHGRSAPLLGPRLLRIERVYARDQSHRAAVGRLKASSEQVLKHDFGAKFVRLSVMVSEQIACSSRCNSSILLQQIGWASCLCWSIAQAATALATPLLPSCRASLLLALMSGEPATNHGIAVLPFTIACTERLPPMQVPVHSHGKSVRVGRPHRSSCFSTPAAHCRVVSRDPGERALHGMHACLPAHAFTASI